jgi:hypothetical protein
MSTQTFTGTLTVMDCPACGIAFGITAEYEQRRRKDHQSFSCPSGHTMSFSGKTAEQKEIDRLRSEAEFQKTRAESWQEDAEQYKKSAESSRRSAAAARGHITRIKRRVSKGVCPCCNRQFSDLHRHMTSQHPEWEGES